MTASKPGSTTRGYIALSLVWLAVLAVSVLFLRRPSGQPLEILLPPTALPSPTPSSVPPTALPATSAPLRVDVAGAVQDPAVYRLPPGSIVADAIDAAGGPAQDAQLDRLNKALPLVDGMQVYVPRLGETPPPAVQPPAANGVSGAGTTKAAAAPLSVNVNSAGAEELDALPGVGPALAQKIIAGRPYGAIDDLLRVAGIGQTVLEGLRPYVTVQ